MIGVVAGVGPYAGLDLLSKILSQTVADKDQDHLAVASLSQPELIADRTAFDGIAQDLRRLDPQDLAGFRNRTLGFVFQFQELLADFTAQENVMMPGRIAGRAEREVRERTLSLLDEVGLSDRSSHPALKDMKKNALAQG